MMRGRLVNKNSPTFVRFWTRLGLFKQMWLQSGNALLSKKDRALALCGEHGPFLCVVSGYSRRIECPTCAKDFNAQYQKLRMSIANP